MRLKIAATGLAALLAVLYLANASWLARPTGELTLLSHRGVYQTFPPEGVEDDTCTATRIRTPTHRFIENTQRRRGCSLTDHSRSVEGHQATSSGPMGVAQRWRRHEPGCPT